MFYGLLTNLTEIGEADKPEKMQWERMSFTPESKKTPEEVAEWRATNEISVTGSVAKCPDPILDFSAAPFPGMHFFWVPVFSRLFARLWFFLKTRRGQF
jgi:hypothetical protein